MQGNGEWKRHPQIMHCFWLVIAQTKAYAMKWTKPCRLQLVEQNLGSSIANRAMCGNDTLITPFLQIGIIEICRRTEDVKTITMNSIQWDIDDSKLCKLLIKARQSASLKNLTS